MSHLRGHLGRVSRNLAPSSLVPQLTFGTPVGWGTGLRPTWCKSQSSRRSHIPDICWGNLRRNRRSLPPCQERPGNIIEFVEDVKTTKNSKTFSLLTCATAPSPKRTRAKVPRVSAKNSRTYLILSVINVFKFYLKWFDITNMTKYFSLVCFHLEPSFILHLYRIFLFRFCKRAAC